VREDKVLVHGVENEVPCTTSQEREEQKKLAKNVTIETVLLALLTDNTADATDEAGIIVVGEIGLYVRQSGENDIGELGDQGDRVVEFIDGEGIIAGRDDVAHGNLGESAAGVQLVELHSCEDGVEGVEDLVAVIDLIVAGDVVANAYKRLDDAMTRTKALDIVLTCELTGLWLAAEIGLFHTMPMQ